MNKLFIIIILVAACIGIKMYVEGPDYVPQDMVGKNIIITGANSGVGFESAKELALRGANIIMACRTESKARKAMELINKAKKDSPVWMNTMTSPNVNEDNVQFLALDLSSFDSVRNFVKQYKSLGWKKLDVLMNNAGANIPMSNTSDGLTTQWQANYVSPVLLTHLLLPEVRKAQDGRIVNVASMAHETELDFDDLNMFGQEGMAANWEMYQRTKLANIMFSAKLQKVLDEAKITNVKSNSLHPGLIATNFLNNMHWTLGYVAKLLELVIMQSPRAGANTQLHVATSPALKTVGGEYFNRLAIAAPKAWALESANQDKLWNWTMTKLNINKFI